MVKTCERVCTNRLFLLGISGEVLLDLPEPFTYIVMQVSHAHANSSNHPLCLFSGVLELVLVAVRLHQIRSREEQN